MIMRRIQVIYTPDKEPVYSGCSVVRSIRTQIHIGESQTRVQGLEYHDTLPLEYDTIQEMRNEVNKSHDRYGETKFDRDEPTLELISLTVSNLDPYLSGGQMDHLRRQLPAEIRDPAAA